MSEQPNTVEPLSYHLRHASRPGYITRPSCRTCHPTDDLPYPRQGTEVSGNTYWLLVHDCTRNVAPSNLPRQFRKGITRSAPFRTSSGLSIPRSYVCVAHGAE